MQNLSKILGIIAVFVALGLGIGFLATRGPSPRTPLPAPSPAPNPVSPGPSTPVRNNAQNLNVQTPPDVAHVSPVPTVLPSNVVTNWEDRLEEILGAEIEDTNKVTQLFDLFPRLPPEGQVEISQHLSNLVEDGNYSRLGALLENTKLPEDVLEVLMADLLNRPNAVKLPMFLEIAKTPNHVKASEAKDLLELYLDEEFGTDWNKWQEKMQEWLKNNPD